MSTVHLTSRPQLPRTPRVSSADGDQRKTRCPPECSQVGGQLWAGLIQLALDTFLGLQQASGRRSLPFTRGGRQLVERELGAVEKDLASFFNLRLRRQGCRLAHRVTAEGDAAVRFARGRIAVRTAVEHY